MLQQVARVAARHGARSISEVTLRLGPLSGVEPALLRAAYLQSRLDTPAADAELVIVDVPVRLRCRRCAAESEAGSRPLRLVCGTCGTDDTQLLSGDEMLLDSIALVF